jgi:hypothetical protein
MIFLRVVCTLVGGMLAMLAPQFALDIAADLAGHSVQASLRVMLLSMAAVALCVSGFLFVGFAGHRMSRTPWKRIVGGVLLLPAFLACLWALFFSSIQLLVTLAGPLLCFAAAVFAIFVFPGAGLRSRRPMRPRDYEVIDPAAAPLDVPR